ncbi:serine/threonine-protein kinase [Striga asiatica]|uniref:Receptor-like serine/threonine-protein kinase n=1 Tax=Striga asiatica TaxID=4170 RepID=A0A5A7R7G0_STRAF|nr:serine/threonine-protein kinase [Striga asiatica]
MGTTFISHHIVFLHVIASLLLTSAIDTLGINQTIADGGTLVSSDGTFTLGFFSPQNSTGRRYLGIWYTISPPTVLWVANRAAPFPDTPHSTVLLRLTESGNLVLVNATGDVIWSTNRTSTTADRAPVAHLLDSGNLIIRDADNNVVRHWQSFDFPTDTFLPGMMLGRNLTSNREVYLSSWRTENDPSPGSYSYHCDPTGYPQNILWSGSYKMYRSGQWNGLGFSGMPYMNPNRNFTFGLTVNQTSVFYYYEHVDPSTMVRVTMNQSGLAQLLLWYPTTRSWNVLFYEPMKNCDLYNFCGAYGICSVQSSPFCTCLDNFVPRDEGEWGREDWSGGCLRRTALNCEGDEFFNLTGIKLPDPNHSWFNSEIIVLEECRARCLRNCSCVAYTRLDIREGGSGCLLYHGDLLDIRYFAEGGQDLYIRVASSELGPKHRKKHVMAIASSASVVGVVLVCLSLFLCIYKRRKNMNMRREEALFNRSHGKDSELPFFKLSVILRATDHFSINHKLGQGGFGPVYKGKLENGEEIAVKRLSKSSAQGVDELKNEVILIAKLQHRNLVRLLGCCIQGDENMLIYEYMPNNSLDMFLFDQTKSMLLDWRKRHNIINGIAKRLLYLHQDSRLRIIHRDLKASNILLDSDMNPKISDFGLARSFGGNETEAHTRRVVGTYGYMSPEYAVDGLFSVKSDVFSFGVLVLEVVSGKRNRGFFSSNHSLNLLGHAWTLYNEENELELVDTCLGDSFEKSQVLRPRAKQPGFFTERDVRAAQSSTNMSALGSINEVTITMSCKPISFSDFDILDDLVTSLGHREV